MAEWPSLAQLAAKRPTPEEILARNKPYVREGEHTYNTPLTPRSEQAFRSWLKQNDVPFDADAPVSDYDMRGFFKAWAARDPRATSALDPNDQRMHYPDYWKTPYHETFSNESQWATPVAPQWNSLDQLVTPGGRIIFDDRAQR